MTLDLVLDYYRQKSRTIQTALATCLSLGIFLTSSLLILIAPAHAAPTDDFVTTWKTDNAGTSDSTSITIPTDGSYTYNYDVDWNNDGVFDEMGITGDVTHDFGAEGTYTIRIQGTFPAIRFIYVGDCQKIININQWGTGVWASMQYAFAGASNLTSTATDAPNLSNVTNMYEVFNNASSFNGDLSAWNTNNVTNMSGMFTNASSFNGDLSGWDTSNVTNMSYMFNSASSFNGDLSNWDTSNVTDMSSMFAGASSFTSDLSNWDTSNVTDMSYMLIHLYSFTSDLSNWDTSNVTNMSYMFYNAFAFTSNISTWDMSSVQNIEGMLSSSGFSDANYSTLLAGWASQSLQPGLTFGVQGLQYCAAAPDRQAIITNFSWVFEGDAEDCTLPPSVTVNGGASTTRSSQPKAATITSQSSQSKVLITDGTTTPTEPQPEVPTSATPPNDSQSYDASPATPGKGSSWSSIVIGLAGLGVAVAIFSIVHHRIINKRIQ